jgi:putative transposase
VDEFFEYDETLFREKYRIKSIRLSNWDYSANGFYFITICTNNMECVFGEIKNGIMGLSEIGCIAAKFWQDIPKHFTDVILDEWIVMPNHVHGSIGICDETNQSPVETRHGASLHGVRLNKFGPMIPKSVSSIINHFKGAVVRWCNKNGCYFQWQPRYYDRIIRNENELNRIREYIQYNPVMWERDRNNKMELWM